MNSNTPSNKPRSNEKRLKVTCITCSNKIDIRKSILAWTESIEGPCGHPMTIDLVLKDLHSQGWNVHDLVLRCIERLFEHLGEIKIEKTNLSY